MPQLHGARPSFQKLKHLFSFPVNLFVCPALVLASPTNVGPAPERRSLTPLPNTGNIMTKSIILAALLSVAAASSFAQASAPKGADKPVAAASGATAKKAHKEHKAKAHKAEKAAPASAVAK